MCERAALVTGASRGIGYAIAELLGAEGYGLTVSARRAPSLSSAAERLRGSGYEVQEVCANLADEQQIRQLVAAHSERYGRLDVLVNSGGLGIGAAADAQEAKFVDLQLAVNIRALILMYRESIALLRAAGATAQGALVVNLASLAGKSPQPWLSVYSATKAAVIAYTEAMNRELGPHGIKSVALCPGFVNTDMTEFIRGSVPPEEMIQTADIAAAVRFLLSLSRFAAVPEIVFQRHGEEL